jgi:hypothetical protein
MDTASPFAKPPKQSGAVPIEAVPPEVGLLAALTP